MMEMFGLFSVENKPILYNIFGIDEKICDCDFDGMAFLIGRMPDFSVRSGRRPFGRDLTA
jgi:hypothetical protein